MRILLLSGSTRPTSTNSAAVRAMHEAHVDGVETEVYTGLVGLPAFVPGDHEPPPEVDDLRRKVARADAVVICTPEYAGTLPGSLKNLLDWLVSSGELVDKPVAWVNVAAAGRGRGAVAMLQTVLGYVSARLLSDACADIPVPRDAVDVDGVISDRHLVERFADLLAVVSAACRDQNGGADSR
jgi:NAD(P)H-dependent FMN reductase